MACNTTKMKFHRHLFLPPSEFTQIYNLAYYEKRLDIPGLRFAYNYYAPMWRNGRL